jgi:adenylate cyclase
LFADLAGFAALTEAHGDEQAAYLAHEFESAAARLLPRPGAEQIKTIGDALMLRVETPAGAVKLGLALTRDLLAECGYPTIRVGVYHGPAVHRADDWFGATVNLAARVSGLARGGDVLLTDATREAAGDVDGVQFEAHGIYRLRNIGEPVKVFSASRRQALDASHSSTLFVGWQSTPTAPPRRLSTRVAAATSARWNASPSSLRIQRVVSELGVLRRARHDSRTTAGREHGSHTSMGEAHRASQEPRPISPGSASVIERATELSPVRRRGYTEACDGFCDRRNGERRTAAGASCLARGRVSDQRRGLLMPGLWGRFSTLRGCPDLRGTLAAVSMCD